MKDDLQLISVVIPAYNAENYINRAIDSVLNQTYQHWEMLVIDDCSTDQTAEKIHAYQDNRIKYHRHSSNQGESAARNTGIQMSQGETVAFLDSDDWWLPEHLSNGLMEIKKTNCDFVYSSTLVYEEDKNNITSVYGPTEEDLQNFPASLYSNNFIQPSASICQKKLFAEFGYFDVSLRYCADMDMWIRLIRRGNYFHYSSKRSCIYRKHAHAATSNYDKMNQHLAKVRLKHFGWEVIPVRQKKALLSTTYKLVADLNIINNPQTSLLHYLKAWKLNIFQVNLIRQIMVAAKNCLIQIV